MWAIFCYIFGLFSLKFLDFFHFFSCFVNSIYGEIEIPRHPEGGPPGGGPSVL